MRSIAFAASLVWGAFLALLLLGAVLDESIGLTVYATSALVVWGVGFVTAGRRGAAGARLALTVIPLSLLGPLAIVPAAILRRRRVRPRRPDAPKPVKPKPVKAALPEPPKPASPEPLRSAEPTAPPLRAARLPAGPARPPRHPFWVLAAMLIASLLAFPVAWLVILFLAVFGGVHVLTANDFRSFSWLSAVAAGAVLAGAAAVWDNQSRARSKRARYLGWSLIAVAAVPTIVETILFTSPRSPTNLARPSVSGRAEVGSRLVGHSGRWTTHDGFDYQWQGCTDTCEDIYGATHRTYVVNNGDLHKRIRLAVSAESFGSGLRDISSNWAYSKKSAAVAP